MNGRYQAVLRLLPRGRSLKDGTWTRRHSHICALLWIHVLVVPVFGAVRGEGLAHSLLDSAVVALFAIGASQRWFSRDVRSAMATLGLVTSSAILTHLSGGLIEMHFHFFVMVVIVSLYQSWLPFLLALGFVILHHGIAGAVAPASVYNHPAALANPWKWALVHGAFILGQSVACLVAWRANEDALDRERVLVKQLQEAQGIAGMGSWEWDLASDTVSWSEQLYRIFGVTKDAFDPSYHGFLERVHPEDRALVDECVQDAHRTGRPFAFDHRVELPDGSIRMVHGRGQVVHGDDGAPIHMTGTAHDVTERREAERKLAQLAAIVQTSEDAMYTIETSGRVLTWNPGAERMFGYSAEEMKGQDLSALLPLGLEHEFRANLEACAGGAIVNFETTRRCKDGTQIQVNVRHTPLIDETGKVTAISSIVRDITEQKRADRELSERTEELARSNADLEQFAHVASHDLQEPLRMVASYVQLLQRRYEGKLDSDADEFIGYAVDGARRMQSLIHDLLQYARLGRRASPPEPTDVKAVVDQAVGNLEVALAETGARISYNGLPTVVADGSQLAQLFQNLICNGIKFRRQEVTPEVCIEAQQRNGEWLFAVRDNGIGIDLAYADKIFTLLQRLHTREEYPGTGIGLSICKKIVERHGGRIWLESEPGKGTTFLFTLPAGRTR